MQWSESYSKYLPRVIIVSEVYGVQVQCILYTVHCTLYTVHCTVYSVQCIGLTTNIEYPPGIIGTAEYKQVYIYVITIIYIYIYIYIYICVCVIIIYIYVYRDGLQSQFS